MKRRYKYGIKIESAYTNKRQYPFKTKKDRDAYIRRTKGKTDARLIPIRRKVR